MSERRIPETLLDDATDILRDAYHDTLDIGGPNFRVMAEKVLRALPAAESVPEGMVLVPKEPTNEMLRAAVDMPEHMAADAAWPFCKNLYRTMIAAAPYMAVAESGWRTMDSAPKDGTRVIVSDGGYVGQGWFHPVEEAWLDCDGIVPTLWQPLPAPPGAAAPAEPVDLNEVVLIDALDRYAFERWATDGVLTVEKAMIAAREAVRCALSRQGEGE